MIPKDSVLSREFGSTLSAHSYDRYMSNHRASSSSSSFVVINDKRSWRPSFTVFQPVLSFMPHAAPLALAAANPFLRLFVERDVEGGGLQMRDYQVIPIPMGQGSCNCDEAHDSGADVFGKEVGTRSSHRTSPGYASANESHGDSSLECGTSGMVVEEDGVTDSWDADPDAESSSAQDENDNTPSMGFARVIPLYFSGIDRTGSVSSLANHYYPPVGVTRVEPSSTEAVSDSLRSNASAAADRYDRACLRECLQGTALDLSLCVSITCKSPEALQFAIFGAWWLSRYHGVSLRLHHLHPAQSAAFKTVARLLFLREVQLDHCVLSEDILQCISASADVVSLTIISCSAPQEVVLRSIDSILRKRPDTRTGGFTDAQGSAGGRGAESQERQPGTIASSLPMFATQKNVASADHVVMNWYLSGVRSLGTMRGLRCLHILHTPLHSTFLPAITTCTSLECLILHRCRGVSSLEPLQKIDRLQSLSLHGLSLTDKELSAVEGCKRLRQLVIDECRQITDLSFLTRLSGTLERLLMPRTLLSNGNMLHIGLCGKLIELHLQSLRHLTDINALKELDCLQVLNVSDNLVADEGLASLQSISGLQRLRLASCRCITSLQMAVGTSRQWAQNLVSLDLSLTNLDDVGLRWVGQYTKLRYLNLHGCRDVSVLSWLKKMISLRWIDLSGTGVTDEEVNENLPAARNLRLLHLGGCGEVSSLAFAVKLHQLEYLSLEATGIDDGQLSSLSNCTRLRFLSLKSCTEVREISALASLPLLIELDISMTAVSGVPSSGEGRRTPRGITAWRSSASSSASPRSGSPLSFLENEPPSLSPRPQKSFFQALEVLHMTGCHCLTKVEELASMCPKLRVLYANQASVTAPRSVGIGFTRTHEHPRHAMTSRKRGVLIYGHGTGESMDTPSIQSSSAAEKSASQPDLLLPFFVPQPPSVSRPQTARMATSPRASHHSRQCSFGGEALQKDEHGPSLQARGTSRVLKLVLRRAALTDSMLNHLCAFFTSLKCLDLTKCSELYCLSGVEQLSALADLSVAQSAVDNDGVMAVSACASLEVLRLTECRNVSDVNCLGTLRRLRVLCLSRTQVTNEGLKGVGKCLALEYLNCSDCRFLSDVNPLGSLKHLIELHLERTDIHDSGIRGVLRCAALRQLYLTRCHHLTSVGDIQTCLPQLEVFDAYGTSIPTRVAGQRPQYACVVL